MDDYGRTYIPEKRQKNYIGYEYKEISGDSNILALLLDGYESFGWEVNESLPAGRAPREPGRR